jgi:SAM-dependent methyltransferase
MMKKRFEEIYLNNEWGNGSGAGSIYKHNQGYILFLQGFLKQNDIRTVVDVGCGDWQFSQYINWNGVKYKGFDIVESVIDNNKERYSSNNVSFHHYSGDSSDLPEADVLIVKDVLQHWSYESINKFILDLRKFKFVLITNCVDPTEEFNNKGIEDGGFSCLDLRLSPFNLNLDEVYSFTNKKPLWLPTFFFKPLWVKKVMLLKNRL